MTDLPTALEDTLADDREGGLDAIIPTAPSLRSTAEMISRGGIDHLLRKMPPGYAEGYSSGPTARPTGRGKSAE